MSDKQKQTDQGRQLRQSESSLQTILQSTADGLLAVDRENRVLLVNERFGEMWRIPQELIAGKDGDVLLQYVLDQLIDPQGFLRKVQQLYASDEDSFDTLYFKDGRIFERLSRPLIVETELRGRLWSFRDVTARVQTEGALRESAQKYQFLTDNMNDIIWTLDMNLRTSYVSPSVETILGFTPEERMKQDIDQQLTLASLSNAREMLVAEIVNEQTGQTDPKRSITLEVEYFHKNGSTRWLENIITGIRDEQGALIGFHGVSRNITERKRAEEALRESEARFKIMFNEAPLGIALIDSLMGHIYSVNPMFAKIAGRTMEEMAHID